MRLFGGDIEFTSEFKVGSCFSFLFDMEELELVDKNSLKMDGLQIDKNKGPRVPKPPPEAMIAAMTFIEDCKDSESENQADIEIEITSDKNCDLTPEG